MIDIIGAFSLSTMLDAVGDSLSDALTQLRDSAGSGVFASIVAILGLGRVAKTRPGDVQALNGKADAGEAVDVPNVVVKINGQRVAKSGTPLRVTPGSVSIVARNSRSLELVPAGPIVAHPGHGMWSEHTIISFVSASEDMTWIRVETSLHAPVLTGLTRVRDRKAADRRRPHHVPAPTGER